jgi:hypothetical protein
VADVNEIFNAILLGASTYRSKYFSQYFPDQRASAGVLPMDPQSGHYSPSWSDDQRTRQVLELQIAVTNCAIDILTASGPQSGPEERFALRDRLIAQLYKFNDILLGGFNNELNMLRSFLQDQQQRGEGSSPEVRMVEELSGQLTREFERVRQWCMFPFLKQLRVKPDLFPWELAEKYRDYDTLITACVELQKKEQLQYYMHENGSFPQFAQHLFQWYLQNGKCFYPNRAQIVDN